MILDEFIYHQKRVLPRWERIGHPIDTLSFLVPILILVFNSSIEAFIIFSFISCLIITKDEFIHAHVCEGGEHWIHSMLFILHPVTFFAVYNLRKDFGNYSLYPVLFSIFLFLIYQILYWRPWWDQKKLLTIRSMNN